MLFNSLHFLLFFPVVVCAYFAFPFRYRWVLLLAASYYFYGCWRWDYLALLLGSTLVDYSAGVGMASTDKPALRRACLAASLTCNIGLLATFKYFNFFGETVNGIAETWGADGPIPKLSLLLPVGISFYTFQSIGYTVDVYRRAVPAQRHLGKFALFVAFFPQLVAGPIERAGHMMPQYDRAHTPDWARIRSGLLQMLVGFAKKVIIADRLATYVNAVYDHPMEYHGWPIIIATYFFAFQIFCDFSGYSDIAIGAARVMGYDLMENFRRPYLATSITDFWHRWHISLSTWMRDYLYIPLGGNRISRLRTYINLFLVFVISGLWHGANWTFFCWGAIHGTWICAERYLSGKPIGARFQSMFPAHGSAVGVFVRRVATFHLVVIAWVFFRAASFSDVVAISTRGISGLGASVGDILRPMAGIEFATAVASILLLLAFQLFRERIRLEDRLLAMPTPIRWAACYALLFGILLFGKFTSQQFIYFQF